MLCSIDSYQLLTGDTLSATGDVETMLVQGQQALEEFLSRPGMLEIGTYTETLIVDSGQQYAYGLVFPTATPVQCTTPGIADLCLLRCINDVFYGPSPDEDPSSPGVWPRWSPLVATVTYIGGLDPSQTDPKQRSFVPQCIVEDIAWWAHLHLNQPAILPVGAVSVHSGDQSVTFKEPRTGTPTAYQWSPGTCRYRRDT